MKPTCIFTVPRTGSQLVMAHFENGGYDSADELLAHYRDTPNTIKHVAAAGTFREQFRLEPAVLQDTAMGLFRHVRLEYKRRMYFLQQQQRPTVVKAFAQSDFFTVDSEHVEQLFNEMDVVVLHRRDGLRAILSLAICTQVNAWHPSPEQMGSTKDALQNLRFEVDEYFFRMLVEGQNLLHLVTKNLQAFSSTAKVIYFEDFQADPVNQLNALLGTNFQYTPHMTKFIDEHEAHITNLERLKELYRKYSLSQ